MRIDKFFHTFFNDKIIFDNIVAEQIDRGYYKLPFQDTSHLDSLSRFSQKNIVVIGIGGSSLGTYAIYNFLGGDECYKQDKQLHFLESTDPLSLRAKLCKIDLEDSVFIVISKSGTTVETISIFKYIFSIVKISNKNCIVITEEDSKLNSFAKSLDIKNYPIDKDVGGRFSVLSHVGLVPLKLLGVDIDKVLDGARSIYNSFFNKEDYFYELLEKSRFMAENKDKYNINAIFSYSERLNGFNKWYVQLWGESLGKIDKNTIKRGLTPIGLLGPVDQHSFLQLIVEGKRDKTVTFIKIKDFKIDIKVPDISLPSLEDLDIVNNLNFSDLINMQADATIESVKNLKDIPIDIIEIDDVTPYTIGQLIFYYELLTSLVAQFIEIDAYDQPGVEFGKVILKNKLNNLNNI